ncbi:hypothetical protein L484_012964 [Morus notabilis]|uniref:TPX2 central domain-containing protein n=1 Tax=Morus notabilis TaxID=981085 RepID=W9S1E0_9ROSA|nr:hypothetical protein L484_012964 [Morus notabilis]
MDGEEELEELVRETYAVEEIDMDYEFDAARFYDFSRVETDCEAREAERWLESYGNYPPSPFIIKLKWRKGVPTGVVNTSALSKDVEDVNANDRELNNHVTQDIISQSKAKSPVKSSLLRSSTLMKPTASHLAKLDQLHLVQSIRSLRLKNKLGNIDDKSSQNSSVTDDLATKRQKLEAGYLSKDAQLKHQALLLHKVPKQKLSRNGKVPLAQKVKQATTVTSLGLNFSTDRRIQDELPIRLFSKMINVVKERSQRLLGGKNFEYWTQSQDSRITTVH